jgi:Ca2+-transporting ATPase
VLLPAAGAGNDYQKDLQFRKLNAQKDIIEVTVTRGGQTLVCITARLALTAGMLNS